MLALPFMFMRWAYRTAGRHMYTLYLFTLTDYKTIFLPVMAFACSTAPIHSINNLLQASSWIWIHLLMCNVSNQLKGVEEDAINRPWRPVPSARLSMQQAVALRWATVALCLLWSSAYGVHLVYVTAILFLTTYAYDELGLSQNPLGKNFCNIGGYATFELGATKIMGERHSLDQTSTMSVILSGLVIFTTIQAQDYPDIEGDAAAGRVTFPIYAPELSRVITLAAIVTWSFVLSWVWNIGVLSRTIFIALGAYVGARYYLRRTPNADKRSYLIFNIWLMLAHILPLHARTRSLCF